MKDVELRSGGKVHGVLRNGLTLEVKQGDRLFYYDLLQSLVQGRAVVRVEVLKRDLRKREGFTDL